MNVGGAAAHRWCLVAHFPFPSQGKTMVTLWHNWQLFAGEQFSAAKLTRPMEKKVVEARGGQSSLPHPSNTRPITLTNTTPSDLAEKRIAKALHHHHRRQRKWETRCQSGRERSRLCHARTGGQTGLRQPGNQNATNKALDIQ